MVRTRKQSRLERGENTPPKVFEAMQSQQPKQSAKRPKKPKTNAKTKKAVAFNEEEKVFPSTSNKHLSPRKSRSRSRRRRYSSDSSPRSSSPSLFRSRGRSRGYSRGYSRKRGRDYHRSHGHRSRNYSRSRPSRHYHRSSRFRSRDRCEYTSSEYSSYESSSDREYGYHMQQRRISTTTWNEDPIDSSPGREQFAEPSRITKRRMSMATSNNAAIKNSPKIPAKRRSRTLSGWLKV